VNAFASPAAYQESAVLTASPGQLVVLLYDGILKFLRQADAALEQGGIEPTHERLQRAEAIITELHATLDLRQGKVAENLQGIYVFWQKMLSEVRRDRDREKLARVMHMVAQLRDAWAQAAGQAQ
jgi:flagellar secretion chaperone FliS